MWVLFFLLTVQIAVGSEFTVGGRNGWAVPTGSEGETLNQWAERLRFHVGDTLLFKYQASQDSVLQVTPEAFQNCNTTSPIATYNDGNTAFKFPQSGPFYFISGAQGHCQKGQKIVVVVMSQGGRRSSAHSPVAAPIVSSPALSPDMSGAGEEGPAMSPFAAPAVAPTSDASSLVAPLVGVLFGAAGLLVAL